MATRKKVVEEPKTNTEKMVDKLKAKRKEVSAQQQLEIDVQIMEITSK